MTDDSKKTRSHEHVLNIDAPPERVWSAITDPAELVNWFPLQAETKPGEGGAITYGWGPDLIGACSIMTWEPPSRLRTSWMEPTMPESSTEEERRRLVVDWFIEGKEGRTVLRLVHSGFGPDAKWDEEYEGTNRGWEYELRSLKHYLERHPGRQRRAIWVRQPVALSAREVWSRLSGPNGLIREGNVDKLGAGDRYRIVLSTGDAVEGVVRLNTPPLEFAGTADNFNDGLIRFGFENCGAGPEAHVFLSTWGVPKEDVDAIEKRLREALRGTYAS